MTLYRKSLPIPDLGHDSASQSFGLGLAGQFFLVLAGVFHVCEINCWGWQGCYSWVALARKAWFSSKWSPILQWTSSGFFTQYLDRVAKERVKTGKVSEDMGSEMIQCYYWPEQISIYELIPTLLSNILNTFFSEYSKILSILLCLYSWRHISQLDWLFSRSVTKLSILDLPQVYFYTFTASLLNCNPSFLDTTWILLSWFIPLFDRAHPPRDSSEKVQGK